MLRHFHQILTEENKYSRQYTCPLLPAVWFPARAVPYFYRHHRLHEPGRNPELFIRQKYFVRIPLQNDDAEQKTTFSSCRATRSAFFLPQRFWRFLSAANHFCRQTSARLRANKHPDASVHINYITVFFTSQFQLNLQFGLVSRFVRQEYRPFEEVHLLSWQRNHLRGRCVSPQSFNLGTFHYVSSEGW